MTWGSSPSLARHLSAVVTAQQPGVMQSLFLKRWKIMRRHSICLYTCFQDATHLKAIVVKAESLYSTCQVWYIMPPPNTYKPICSSLSTRWLSFYEGFGLLLTQPSWWWASPSAGKPSSARFKNSFFSNGQWPFLSFFIANRSQKKTSFSFPDRKISLISCAPMAGFPSSAQRRLLRRKASMVLPPGLHHQWLYIIHTSYKHHIQHIIMACKEWHWPGLHHQMLLTRFFVISFLQG